MRSTPATVRPASASPRESQFSHGSRSESQRSARSRRPVLWGGSEPGIRRFCLWALGLAVLTLKKIVRTPGFTAGNEVKIPRSSVATTTLLTNAAVGSDRMLGWLFAFAGSGLPLAMLGPVRPPGRAAAGRDLPKYEEPRLRDGSSVC